MAASLPTNLVLDHLSPKDFIIIKGAKMHNLKNLSVAIPRNQLVVVTGLSGSGKSSLIFDTLFVEAQRMYIESLSSYARQFLGKLEKPAVDAILGVAPAVAIQQAVTNKNPRSTVGTVTELCDYLNLLYARIGTTYAPGSGQKVKKDSVSDVVDYVNQHEDGTKVLILYPIIVAKKKELLEKLRVEQGKGFTRVMQGNKLFAIEELLEGKIKLAPSKPIYGLVDRVVVKKDDQDNQYRIADSVQVAFFEGMGSAVIEVVGLDRQTFSDRFELDGMTFELPTVHFFSFNTPHGACKTCEGMGQVIGIDEQKVIPNPTRSVAEGAIAPWSGHTMQIWLHPLFSKQKKALNFPIHTPYDQLSPAHKKILWEGSDDFIGIEPFFDFCATQLNKMQCRVLLAHYRGKILCPSCQGTRVRPDAQYVKINNHSIVDLLLMPIHQLILFFDALQLTEREMKVAKRILVEVKDRLRYLAQVGLGYLALSRPVTTLSGGEYQRIKLATALGSPLFGTIYILDEPTIGLHPRDTNQLVNILLDLRNQGNTVIVVEHEPLVMHAADTLIEIGPEAGSHGGNLVFQGSVQALMEENKTHTARYLNKVASIATPAHRRPWRNRLLIQGATMHNLKQVTVEIPLNVLTVVTGVSGSGKSSLIKAVLYPALEQYAERINDILGIPTSECTDTVLSGDLHCIQLVTLVDQHPLGKSSRSNLATYMAIYDYIRDLFTQTKLARERRYQAGHFSFNSEKGQCTGCYGDGEQKIEMQFMADIFLPCETCKGSRFKPEILEVTYAGKHVAEVLSMTVDEALDFFADHASIHHKLKVLEKVGLGYVQLGQSSSSLSGGEAQRLKLAYYLEKELVNQRILFIFDEPTTGLHMHDVHKLLVAMHALVNQGHSVVVIEHNMDIIKNADWIIDLGPDGGVQGGQVVFTGTPEALMQVPENHTAHYLRKS
ncbi:excinuclease ABC subunit UvrA [Cardinium endosymbiont of Tipula unca]|uniref:excinuclease ABC subunit UvrA n=1 Tax=Cardinium endosymbiont of Tipula unca TaxID=3066216 RepID=UPI0030D3AD64